MTLQDTIIQLYGRLRNMTILLANGKLVTRSVYFTNGRARILLWRDWYRVSESDTPTQYQYIQKGLLTDKEIAEETGKKGK
jgi:hypothetical protein